MLNRGGVGRPIFRPSVHAGANECGSFAPRVTGHRALLIGVFGPGLWLMTTLSENVLTLPKPAEVAQKQQKIETKKG